MKLQAIFLGLALSCGFFSSNVYAGGGESCTPELNIQGQRYNRCSHLPILDPANDNRVNTLLLLSDLGLAKIEPISSQQSLWQTEYNDVPFQTHDFIAQAQQRIPHQRTPFNKQTDDIFFEERCGTLNSGAERFQRRIQALRNLTKLEKKTLLKMREQIKNCGDTTLSPLEIPTTWSKVAQDYVTYLNASIGFYQGGFDQAIKDYQSLNNSSDPWLKETSQYMLIRSYLNASFEKAKNEYGDVDLQNIDYPSLTLFFKNITQYFKVYPQGEYAVTSRGLMRRGYWLLNRQDLLIRELMWQIQHPNSKFYNLEIDNVAAEIDRRIFQNQHFDPKLLQDPFLLTIYDLMRMRQMPQGERPITWSQLNDQKDYFQNEPELFRYLRALHLFFVQNKPKDALQYLPLNDPQTANSALQLSQIVLKGRILEKLQQPHIDQYWLSYLEHANNAHQRGLFEVALLKYFNHPLHFDKFLGSDSVIRQPFLQKHFIEKVADETALTQMLASAKKTQDQHYLITYTLLNNALIHQNYALFNQAYQTWLPKNAALFQGEQYQEQASFYESQPPFAQFIWKGEKIGSRLRCGTLIEITRKLAQQPNDLAMKICLGEYMRSVQALDLQSRIKDPERSRTFKGTIFARGNVYKEIIEKDQPGELHAYALFRAVRCYAPTGNNDCGDENVPLSVRKQWFSQLKKQYPESEWAKSLQYYW